MSNRVCGREAISVTNRDELWLGDYDETLFCCYLYWWRYGRTIKMYFDQIMNLRNIFVMSWTVLHSKFDENFRTGRPVIFVCVQTLCIYLWTVWLKLKLDIMEYDWLWVDRYKVSTSGRQWCAYFGVNWRNISVTTHWRSLVDRYFVSNGWTAL